MAADDLCRVTVLANHDDRQIAVDLALPSRSQVALLIPSIVDIAWRDSLWPADAAARGWRLSHVGGPSLDESMTLSENDVRDGALLVLGTTDIPTPEPLVAELCETVANVTARTGDGDRAARIIGGAACLWSSAAGAVALVWSGVLSGAAGHTITAAVIAAFTGLAAVVLCRARSDRLPSCLLSITAVIFTAAVGFLAVPSGPGAPNLCLAAAAASAVAILLVRVTDCGTVCLTAIATLSTLAATVAAGSVAWAVSAQVAGAVLATASLGTLGVAARLSIMMARLSSAMPIAGDQIEGEPTPTAGNPESLAVRGHQTLSGLVVGSSAAATLGTVVVASGCHRDVGSWLSGAAFVAVIGLALMLRALSHADQHRRTALIVCGILSFTVAFALIIVAAPRQANWAGGVAAITGLGALRAVSHATISPVARRGVELLEYAALAMVVPLACWVADLYGVVRSLSWP